MSIKASYNRWSKIYDTNLNKTRDLDQLATQSVLDSYDFQKALDLGCGTGKNTQWLQHKAKKVVAMDFSEGMLEKAKAKIQANNVQFQQADITQPWDLENQSFDLISCNLVLEHLSNLDFIFQQAALKLEPKGLFFICELHPYKQYNGSKARIITSTGEEEVLEVYTHHLSDFTQTAKDNDFNLLEVQEWFDDKNRNNTPRLISFLFQNS